MNFEEQAADIVTRYYKSLIDDVLETLSTPDRIAFFSDLQKKSAFSDEEMELIAREHLKRRKSKKNTISGN